MIRIRAVEEAIADRYAEQKMRCPTHLSIGQEGPAAAVGAVNERGTLLLLPVADAALRAFPGEAPALLQALLQRLFAAALGVGAPGNTFGSTDAAKWVKAGVAAFLSLKF
jgi:pyruvate dehydrogenase E1 component alpha subunit